MTVSLQFSLEAEEGWPPVGSESIPFEIVANGYRALIPPLFVKDLSVDDVIQVLEAADGFVSSWKHITQSPRSTIWVLRLAESDQIDALLEATRSLGCTTAGSDELGSYAVDVPAEVPLTAVDHLIEALDPEIVAVAYPSLRHPDE